jgi:hypothetical protein
MKTDEGEQTCESKAFRERATEVRPEQSRTKNKATKNRSRPTHTHTHPIDKRNCCKHLEFG